MKHIFQISKSNERTRRNIFHSMWWMLLVILYFPTRCTKYKEIKKTCREVNKAYMYNYNIHPIHLMFCRLQGLVFRKFVSNYLFSVFFVDAADTLLWWCSSSLPALNCCTMYVHSLLFSFAFSTQLDVLLLFAHSKFRIPFISWVFFLRASFFLHITFSCFTFVFWKEGISAPLLELKFFLKLQPRSQWVVELVVGLKVVITIMNSLS